MDSQVTEAIYTGGLLRPIGRISLRESERVRLIIERTEPSQTERQSALERLRAGIREMGLSLSAPPPARDELHDRV